MLRLESDAFLPMCLPFFSPRSVLGCGSPMQRRCGGLLSSPRTTKMEMPPCSCCWRMEGWGCVEELCTQEHISFCHTVTLQLSSYSSTLTLVHTSLFSNSRTTYSILLSHSLSPSFFHSLSFLTSLFPSLSSCVTLRLFHSLSLSFTYSIFLSLFPWPSYSLCYSLSFLQSLSPHPLLSHSYHSSYYCLTHSFFFTHSLSLSQSTLTLISTCQVVHWQSVYLFCVMVCKLYFFYMLLQPCYGTLLILPVYRQSWAEFIPSNHMMETQ